MDKIQAARVKALKNWLIENNVTLNDDGILTFPDGSEYKMGELPPKILSELMRIDSAAILGAE